MPPSIEEKLTGQYSSNNHSYLEDYQIQRERQNAQKYRRFYSDLLSKHQGILEQAWKGANDDCNNQANDTSAKGNEENTQQQQQESCTTEPQLIQAMWVSERNAIAVGLVCGCALLGTIRGMTPVVIRFFGETKVQAVRKADEEAKKMGTYKYQRAFAWLVEGGFSFWVANRAYHYQSKTSDGAYEHLAKIPLCSGKSVIADNVCEEWVNITTNHIPNAFWKNLETAHQGRLSEERAWRAIRNFSNNCVKRAAFERQITLSQQQQGRRGGAPDDNNNEDDKKGHIPLPCDVPVDMVLMESDIEKLVQDSPV